MEPHRPGRFNRKNKPHKGEKKRSQGLPRSSSVRELGQVTPRSIVRRNQQAQQRKVKREDFLAVNRSLISSPIMVAIIDFSNTFTLDRISTLHTFDPSTTVKYSQRGHWAYIYIPKFRTRYQIVVLNRKELFSSIDLAKISDILLIVHSINVQRFEIPELMQDDYFTLDAIYNHCLPTTLHSIIGLNDINDPRQKDNIKRAVFEFINKRYPGMLDNPKLRALDTPSDLMKFMHQCSDVKLKKKRYCSYRSQMLADDYTFCADDDNPSVGSLLIDGFVRHNYLNPYCFAYIPEFGEFEMDFVQTISNPYEDNERMDFTMFADDSIPKKVPLEESVPVEKIVEEEEKKNVKSKKKANIKKKKVPSGTSSYQAAWMSDEEESDEDDVSDFEDEINKKRRTRCASNKKSNKGKKNQARNINVKAQNVKEGSPDINYDKKFDMEEEQKELSKFKEARMYEMFPDEIDTPVDRPARERFSKYRGLQSFRTSYWDPRENLPPEYSRIFKFENFNVSRKRILKSAPHIKGADAGLYVQVTLINVPIAVYEYFQSNPSKPLVLYTLLAHEHKMCVMNIVVKKVPTFTTPIESKERLIFHVGCRRFAANPIFSAHNNGNKHKYEKYLLSDVASVATIYAPITYPPAPILIYKEFPEDGSHQLVAVGTILDLSPDRLIIKRYVLSGHPFKINRRNAVVRHMFFNREDILWFRPVELRTKFGCHGNILEPLGTHGHMKCRFDNKLNSQDTVLLFLFKRVFPKWYYEPLQPNNEPKIILNS